MPVYSGKYRYLDEKGAPLGEGPCQLSFDEETCLAAPASGAPLAFDLGDVDRTAAGEWDLRLTLYTGRRLELRQFGPAFGRMSQELLAAWRERTVRCLLLEDLEEIARYEGVAAWGGVEPTRSEIRIFKSNIAVLPQEGMPAQWRLAEVDAIVFDETAYSIALASGAERLVLTKLAKKTDECLADLTGALGNLRQQSALALHKTFPFLNADQLQRLATLMPEGRSVRLTALAAIDPKLPDALIERAVDARLKPYFDALRSRAEGDSPMAGFKFVRKDEEEEPEAEGEEQPEEAAAAGEEEEEQPLFFWFFFPLRGGRAVAWEASTGSGRATYFFRLAPGEQVDAAIAGLTRGLALVNFRREPVYLSDDALERQPKFRRYAIGRRKLADLRRLRGAMLGRAVHTSVEKWMEQVEAYG